MESSFQTASMVGTFIEKAQSDRRPHPPEHSPMLNNICVNSSHHYATHSQSYSVHMLLALRHRSNKPTRRVRRRLFYMNILRPKSLIFGSNYLCSEKSKRQHQNVNVNMNVPMPSPIISKQQLPHQSYSGLDYGGSNQVDYVKVGVSTLPHLMHHSESRVHADHKQPSDKNLLHECAAVVLKYISLCENAVQSQAPHCMTLVNWSFASACYIVSITAEDSNCIMLLAVCFSMILFHILSSFISTRDLSAISDSQIPVLVSLRKSRECRSKHPMSYCRVRTLVPVDMHRSTKRSVSNRGVNISLLNCRSVCNKAALVEQFVVGNHIDILAVTETWLTPDAMGKWLLQDCTPQGYKTFHVPRPIGRGGGLAFIYRQELLFSPHGLSSPTFTSMEVSLARLTLSSSRTCGIILIYRPPHGSVTTFITEFADLLSLYCEDEDILVIGDFNIRIDVTSQDTSLFLSTLAEFDLVQHVSSSTHVRGHTLDLVLTRSSSSIINSISLGEGVADHNAVHIILQMTKPEWKRKHMNVRHYKKMDLEAFREELSESQSSSPTNPDVTADVLVAELNTTITEILNAHVPLRERSIVQKPLVPWWTEELNDAKRVRRRLERKWRKTMLELDCTLYSYI